MGKLHCIVSQQFYALTDTINWMETIYVMHIIIANHAGIKFNNTFIKEYQMSNSSSNWKIDNWFLHIQYANNQ